MRLLIPMGLTIVIILLTLIMWISGSGFYITYVPAGTEDGIAQYSPLWILAIELVAAYFLFIRQLWGVVIQVGPAFAISFDIYPAWKLLGQPDLSLKFHIAITALMWITAISGGAAYRYLNYQ